MRVTSDMLYMVTGSDASRLYQVLTRFLMTQDTADYPLVEFALDLRDACGRVLDQESARTREDSSPTIGTAA